MGKNLTTNTTQPKEPKSSARPVHDGKRDNLGIHLLDTTWRIALSFLLFALPGVWADNRYDTKPLFTIIGLALGTLSMVLVMRDYLARYLPETLDLITGKDTDKGAKK